MQNTKNKAFTLVELLVVITILAIISVVAYQNFGGAVDKAVSGRKISDVSTIETSLQQYNVDKNYYPKTGEFDATTNLWGYNSGVTATPSNKIVVVYDNEAIESLSGTLSRGGGAIYGTGTLGQIGAKGTIGMDQLSKKYLSKDLYDPELGDIKVNGSTKMIESGIGRYVYAVYKDSNNWSSTNLSGVAYNIAYTIKKSGSDKYLTKIVGDYDEQSCYEDSDDCPNTLIGTFSGAIVGEGADTTDTIFLVDGQEEGKSNSGSEISGYNSSKDNYGLPYAVTDFASN